MHEDEGVAIFTVYPILETSHIILTRNFSDPVDQHQRVCLRALIDTPSGNLTIIISIVLLSSCEFVVLVLLLGFLSFVCVSVSAFVCTCFFLPFLLFTVVFLM